jgi:hypothetical protein
MSSKPTFSFDDFRKWMKDQDDQGGPHIDRPKKSLIGTVIECKVSLKNLISKMDLDEGDSHEVAYDFHENGGTITQVDGKNFLVEVDSGSFYIRRVYVRRS